GRYAVVRARRTTALASVTPSSAMKSLPGNRSAANWSLCYCLVEGPAVRRTGFMERGAVDPGESLGLDAREPHHLGTLLGFRGDEATKVGGRARNHCTAQIGEPCLKLGIGEGAKEDKAGWSSFLKHLKERGLVGVRLIISDACLGLAESAAEFFPDAAWQ